MCVCLGPLCEGEVFNKNVKIVNRLPQAGNADNGDNELQFASCCPWVVASIAALAECSEDLWRRRWSCHLTAAWEYLCDDRRNSQQRWVCQEQLQSVGHWTWRKAVASSTHFIHFVRFRVPNHLRASASMASTHTTRVAILLVTPSSQLKWSNTPTQRPENMLMLEANRNATHKK